MEVNVKKQDIIALNGMFSESTGQGKILVTAEGAQNLRSTVGNSLTAGDEGDKDHTNALPPATASNPVESPLIIGVRAGMRVVKINGQILKPGDTLEALQQKIEAEHWRVTLAGILDDRLRA